MHDRLERYNNENEILLDSLRLQACCKPAPLLFRAGLVFWSRRTLDMALIKVEDAGLQHFGSAPDSMNSSQAVARLRGTSCLSGSERLASYTLLPSSDLVTTAAARLQITSPQIHPKVDANSTICRRSASSKQFPTYECEKGRSCS